MKLYQLNPICAINASNDFETYYRKSWIFDFSQKIKLYYPYMIIENHFLHPRLKNKIEFNNNGIKNVIHPATKGRIHHNDVDLFSVSFLHSIKEMKDGILINHKPFTFLSIYLLNELKHKPYIVQTHGEGNPSLACSILRHNYRLKIMKYFEPRIIACVDYYLAGSIYEREFLRERYNNIKIRLFKGGIDFNSFKPKISKDNKKITLLYVGKFYKAKGVHILIDAYLKLKEKYQMDLMCIGGSENDELYNFVKANANICICRIEADKLRRFYEKADIYIMPTPKEDRVMILGGIGTAPIEAMAHNIPVITNNLVHFPDPTKIKVIGSLGEPDYILAIENVINTLGDFNSVRDEAIKYYDDEVVVSEYVEICKEISQKYKLS